MKKVKTRLVMLTVVSIVLMFSFSAHAEYYTLGGQEFSFDGYFRQELAYNPNDDSQTNFEGIHTAYSILYGDLATEFGRNWECRGIFRLWADWAYAINRGDSHWDKFFRGSQEELMFLDNFEDIVRELYVTYNSSKMQIRVGRQQVGWGESDGLRLMDVVNPLDLRRGPFYDTQGYSEVRIPKWLLKFEYYPETYGFMSDMVIQFIWNPGDIQENQILQLPPFIDTTNYPAGATRLPNTAGVWAIPTPDNFHGNNWELTRKDRTDSIENSEFGLRVSFNAAGTYMTLNFWHGISHEHLMRFDRFAIATEGPGAGVPSAFGTLYYPRVTYAGITANREIEWLSKALGISTNPVVRFEGLYSFDQETQSDRLTIGLVELAPGLIAPAPANVAEIFESDQIRYMLGFDWPIRLKWLNPKKNFFISAQMFHIHTVELPPNRAHFDPSIPSHGMVANPGADAAPYTTWNLSRNQFYTTLFVKTDYMNDRLTPSVLYVQDLDTGDEWVKSQIQYKIGDHWRPAIQYLYIDGGHQNGQFGLWRERDEIVLRIEYQF